MLNSDRNSDEIQRLQTAVDNPVLTTCDDVRQFVRDFTSLIWDYKIVGEVYRLYPSEIEYHKQNRKDLHTSDEIAREVLDFTAAFPDLRADIEHIIVYKVDDTFYKVFRRLRYRGTNSGFSRYGPPTHRSLGDGCLNLSLFHLKCMDGTWTIPFEVNSDSEAWIREVEGGAPVSKTLARHTIDKSGR